jgi:hypothetical protein
MRPISAGPSIDSFQGKKNNKLNSIDAPVSLFYCGHYIKNILLFVAVSFFIDFKRQRSFNSPI